MPFIGDNSAYVGAVRGAELVSTGVAEGVEGSELNGEQLFHICGCA